LSSQMIQITNKLKDEKIKWNENDKKIIKKKIFKDIQHAPTMAHINQNKDFKVYCDAKERSLGSILIHDKSIVGIYSYKFNNTESNFSISEKELFLIVKSPLIFRSSILAHKILVFTDRKNAMSLKHSFNKRANRWLMLVSEFAYKINFLQGSSNKGADFISRLNAVKTIYSNDIFSEMNLLNNYNANIPNELK
ncbi:Transposon Tf2-8 polyprotein, partial [Dictyocoela muelleri]